MCEQSIFFTVKNIQISYLPLGGTKLWKTVVQKETDNKEAKNLSNLSFHLCQVQCDKHERCSLINMKVNIILEVRRRYRDRSINKTM